MIWKMQNSGQNTGWHLSFCLECFVIEGKWFILFSFFRLSFKNKIDQKCSQLSFFFIILKQIRQAESKINFFTQGLNRDRVNIFVSIIH